MPGYAEGDFVEVVKGRTRISGVLVAGYRAGVLFFDGAGRSIDSLRSEGFTVATIERAKPALPTEPGHYLHRNGIDVLFLTNGLSWVHDGSFMASRSTISDCMPLTPLAPVAETAKKVLDAIDALWDPGDVRYFGYDKVSKVAAEFGVTGDAS